MNILIADDDPVSRRLVEVSLRQAGYSVAVASNGAEALRLVEQKEGSQLAVLDWMMPELDGVEVCRMIRKVSREPYVYIILLTAKGHQTEIVEGLEAGADDYITKPFDLAELKARLRSGKRILELQAQIVAARDQLRIQAGHDSLTGLFNRVAILEILERECARSRREGSPVGVMMADLDHFKLVNDTHGHQAGDAMIRETARRMLASVRSYDSIGRYGGEEFMVVAPGCTSDMVMEQAERLRESIAGEAVCSGDVSLSATISIGVAATSDTSQPEKLIRAADEALYAAKNGGRNKVATALCDNLAVTPSSS